MLSPDEAVKLHGHKGPFLALGYKAGMYAHKSLKPKNIEDMYCIVKLPYRTPYSCIVDGIQASTYCTVGKCNIRIIESEDIEIEFSYNGKKVVFKPRVDVGEILKKYDLEKSYEIILDLDINALFEVRKYY